MTPVAIIDLTIVTPLGRCEVRVTKGLPPNPLDHQGLVWRVAGWFFQRGRTMGLDIDDLASAGQVGLLEACRRYEPDRGYQFSTYATSYIKHHISDALKHQGWPIRIPMHCQDMLSKLRNAKPEARRALRESFEPGMQVLLAQAERILAKRRAAPNECRVEDCPDHRDIPKPALDEDEREKVRQWLGILTDRERLVVTAHYALDGGQPIPLAHIGKRFGFSRQRAMQIHNAALQRLRTHLAQEQAVA